MNTGNDIPRSATNLVDPVRIGFGWGIVFALPALAFVLLMLLDEAFPYAQFIAQAAVLLVAPLLLVLAGAWWATHRRAWQLVLGAVAVGFVLMVCLIAVLVLSAWLKGNPFQMTDSLKPFLVAWAILGCWALVLALVVSFHVRRALRRTRAGGDTRPDAKDAVSGPRFVFLLVMSLTVPLLLSAPVVWLLHYDIGLRDNANAILAQEIDKTRAQLGDVADYDKILAPLLSRKQILDMLEPYAAKTADVLHVVGRLPDGVQLQSLETKGDRVFLTIHRTSTEEERALVEALQRGGFRGVDISRPTPESDVDIIAATSTRMYAR